MKAYRGKHRLELERLMAEGMPIDEIVDHILDETWDAAKLILDIITMTGFAVWRTQCMRMAVRRAMREGGV